MAEVINGKLIWQGEGKARRRLLRWQNKKGEMTQGNRFLDEQLAAELRDQQENEIDVHLELENGQPRRIRPINQAWVPSRISPPPKRAGALGTTEKVNHESSQFKQAQTTATRHGSENLMPNSFHNPYNFIPALPRDGDKVEANGLGDREPLGHDRYYDDHYTGRLRVKMTVKTPLLLPDTSRVKLTDAGSKNEHRSYPVRIGLDGKPHIQPSAIKGMLRSDCEAVTNSRLAVFNKHDERLAFRAEARPPIAARIEKTGGHLVICKFNRIATLVRYRKHYNGEIDKLERSNSGGVGRALPYSGSTSLPEHEDAVWVSVSRRYSRSGSPLGFQVDAIQPRALGSTCPPGFEAGWVCISGPNTKEKVYERVFLENAAGAPIPPIPLSPDHEKLWKELIKNYKSIHEDDLKQRKSNGNRPGDYLGNNPGDTAWSRHIYTDKDSELREGTLCFLIEDAGKITAILPVMISRRLHGVSPLELLHTSLRPAKNLLQLSPADRVFGWVSQEDGKGAYRGQLRVGTVECESESAIENLVGSAAHGDAQRHGLPLAILGQPKPQQGRFYIARNPDGDCQPNKLTTEQAGYTEETEYPGYLLNEGKKESKSLRGRKAYPHHAKLPDGYWIDGQHERWRDNSLEDKTQAGLKGKFYQEYRRPRSNDQDRDNQNRSIHGWVKPQTEFVFTVHVTNLSGVELGALVWLLNLNEFEKDQAAQSYSPETVEYFHRLGGGKPLGFGSVRLDIVGYQIHSGQEMKKRYQSIDGAAQAYDANAAVTTFRQAVESAYGDGNSFREVRFIKAFLAAASGFTDGLPIHYPRSSPTPNPLGESFKWFVNNAKKGGPKLALGDLDGPDPGLPILS